MGIKHANSAGGVNNPAFDVSKTAWNADHAQVTAADIDFSVDNTTGDSTTGHHGLLPKLAGGTTDFLRADGAWDAPAGGGAALSVLGYNTLGGSAAVFSSTVLFMKKFTLTATQAILGVGVGLRCGTLAYTSMNVGIFKDNGSGTPTGSPIAVQAFARGTGEWYIATGTDMFVDFPITAMPMASGDYWAAVQLNFQETFYSILYDSSGTDKEFTETSDSYAIVPMSRGTLASASRKYSIRILVVG